MKATIPLLLLTMLATGAQAAETRPALDPAEARQLARELDGKQAGKPVTCVSTMNGNNLRALGDHVLIYRVGRKLVYRNDLLGTCHGLRRGDTLVMHIQGSQYCRGDIAHVINPYSGSWTGSCALGDFVPYRAAEAEKAAK
jgi:hypothetical protein